MQINVVSRDARANAKMHVGKNKDKCIEGMKVEDVDLEVVEEVVYLGNILSSDGKNAKNIKDRVFRGIGIITRIFTILENTAFGASYFEVAVLLRNSLLVSSVCFNSEVWYGLTEKDLADLGYLDRIFFSKLFNLPETTAF